MTPKVVGRPPRRGIDLGEDVFALLFTRSGWKNGAVGALLEVPACRTCPHRGSLAETGSPRGRCALTICWTNGSGFRLNDLDPLDLAPTITCPCGGVAGEVMSGEWSWA